MAADTLAQFIRQIDAGNRLGAGALAEKIVEWMATQAPAPAPEGEPLFLLHCGQIDSSGEQDDWDIEADSGKRVEEFCRLHPDQTVKLYPHVQAPAVQHGKEQP